MIITLTGGTGTVGSALAKRLKENGHEVRILTRNPKGREGYFFWDPGAGEIDDTVLDNCDVIVHLAGSPVAAGRWTSQRRKDILHSRVGSAQLLYRVLEEKGIQLKRYVSASAIGIYGHKRSEILTEDASKGKGFLTDVCERWEESADRFADHGADVYKSRIGIVMSYTGGFVESVSRIIRMGIGAVLGSGKQITSWVHIKDLVGILSDMTEGKIPAGTYNAVAPKPVAHAAIMKGMAKRMNRKIWLPNASKFALQILFGDLSNELLSDQTVSSEKVKKAGYVFQFTDIDSCLDDIYSSLSSSSSGDS